MAEKKITKKEKYGMLRILAENEGNDMLVEFCDNEIASLDRKSSKVDEKKNEEHSAIIDSIRAVLSATPNLSCSEIMKAVNSADGSDYSLNKISAMLTKMGANGSGEVVKTMDKKTAKFSLV